MKKIIVLLLLAFTSTALFAQSETTVISPSWGQAWHWGAKTFFVILGLVLIAAAAYILYKHKDDGKTGIIIGAVALVALGLTSILGKPLSVKWNNDKKVNTEYLNRVGEGHIWDSLERNCLIVDGPHGCYK